jgi:pimeloyl-ACP methyl ester carboxylesterase
VERIHRCKSARRFDENGDARALYATSPDSFFAGPGVGLATPVESRVEFQRDAAGRVTSLVWRKTGARPRIAHRTDTERSEDVRFSNGGTVLSGALLRPNTSARTPAVILVHGSGPQDREFVLPLARFLVRRGMAVLGYDKRGVGGSTGDWRTASFDDLASDVIAAHGYLQSRPDIDRERIGLLGWSQAGWIMPIAATRSRGIAFIVSVSGAGIPAAETTIDQARNEMTARGMKPEVVGAIVGLMELQYRFARTGDRWDEYASAREKLVARLGRAPDTFPATRDDPHWQFIRRLYFYDPAPTLRQLRVPTLAIFGELDNNIVAEKNRAAWDNALKAAGNSDYELHVLSRANHLMLEAKVGSNAEMPSLQRFVPGYSRLVVEWLATRIPGLASQ